MSVATAIYVGAILGGAFGLVAFIESLYASPEKSPAQRRAQREDCRSKGL